MCALDLGIVEEPGIAAHQQAAAHRLQHRGPRQQRFPAVTQERRGSEGDELRQVPAPGNQQHAVLGAQVLGDAVDQGQQLDPEDDVPEDQQKFLELNAELSAEWPVITEMKDAPEDADDWREVKDKFQYLER